MRKGKSAARGESERASVDSNRAELVRKAKRTYGRILRASFPSLERTTDDSHLCRSTSRLVPFVE